MTETCFTLEDRGAVVVATLHRPPAGALNHAALRELRSLLPRLGDAAAVVLTGEGRFFSAGLDLVEVFGYDDAQSAAFAEDFDEAIAGLFALEAPLVAAVNGHAVAGGAVLAAAADFRLVADGAGRVGLTEIQVGVPFPASALEVVRHRCAGPHLYAVLQRGQLYAPADAVAVNLADELVPAAVLMDRAMSLAAELGSRPRAAFAATKRALRAEALARMAAARRGGSDPAWAAWRTPEVLAAVARYRERALGRR